LSLLDNYKSKLGTVQQLIVGEVLKTNDESQKYGLMLSPQEAHELVMTRDRAIQNHGRFELGIEVVNKIINAFCSSPYINPEDYLFTLNELVEIFYYMKNETEDSIGDDELIGLMQEFFNHSCEGSIELLKNRELGLFARNMRRDRQAAEYL